MKPQGIWKTSVITTGFGVRQPSGAFGTPTTFQSARGLAHSKTLPRFIVTKRHTVVQGFKVRLSVHTIWSVGSEREHLRCAVCSPCSWLARSSRNELPPTNPPPPTVTLSDFRLLGNLSSNRVTFTLTATANVENSKGGSLELLSGPLALTEVGAHPKWELRAEQGKYVAVFGRSGKYPIQIKFTAAVKQNDNWNAVDFRVASSAVQPITLQGLGADTQFEFAGAARPERQGNDFVSFLPADGAVKLSWKEARKAEEGKLFYAAEMRSQISVSPGLMRQVALLDFKVMQGELSRVTLRLHGAGEVTRVAGDQVLRLECGAGDGLDRPPPGRATQPAAEGFVCAPGPDCRRRSAPFRKRPTRCVCSPRARRVSPATSAS